MESLQIAQAAAVLLDNKRGRDIRVLQVEDFTVMTDYFVIATGTSATHLRTLSEEIELGLKKQSVMPLHIEGRDTGNWLLLDYGGVVIHLFTAETRTFYNLERLWDDAAEVKFATEPEEQHHEI